MVVFFGSRSWRIADVADVFAPATGMCLMNDYAIFKVPAVSYRWLQVKCTVLPSEFL
jgi:hypothetical protein